MIDLEVGDLIKYEGFSLTGIPYGIIIDKFYDAITIFWIATESKTMYACDDMILNHVDNLSRSK